LVNVCSKRGIDNERKEDLALADGGRKGGRKSGEGEGE
jgi:hypothetical protein